MHPVKIFILTYCILGLMISGIAQNPIPPSFELINADGNCAVYINKNPKAKGQDIGMTMRLSRAESKKPPEFSDQQYCFRYIDEDTKAGCCGYQPPRSQTCVGFVHRRNTRSASPSMACPSTKPHRAKMPATTAAVFARASLLLLKG